MASKTGLAFLGFIIFSFTGFYGVPHLATFISFFFIVIATSFAYITFRGQDSNQMPLDCKSSFLTTRPYLLDKKGPVY